MKRNLPLCLLLCLSGCVMDNPLFLLKDWGDTRGNLDTTGTTSDGTTVPTSGETPDPTSSGGETASVESTSTSPDPTSSSSSSSPTSTTGESTSEDSTGESTSGETTGPFETTGEDLGMIYWDLYKLCPSAGVQWLGGKTLNIPFECNGNGDPYVGQIPQISINNKITTDVLDFSPTYFEAGGTIKGDYPLNLKAPEVLNASLQAGVHCPKSPDQGSPCNVHVKLAVEINNLEVAFVEATVDDNESVNLQLDLFTIPGLVEGGNFDAVLYADVGAEGSSYDHAYFIHPRVTGNF